MMYPDFWEREGKEKVRKAMIDGGIDMAEIEAVMSAIDDVISEVIYEAKSDGAWEESYYHVCNPD